MKVIKNYCACLLLLILSQTARSQSSRNSEWIYLAASTDGTEFYVRSNGVSSGDIKTVWEKTVSASLVYYTEAGQKSTVDGYAVKKIDWDCRNGRSQLLAIAIYNKTGNVLSSSEFKSYQREWQEVYPESIGEALLNKICEMF